MANEAFFHLSRKEWSQYYSKLYGEEYNSDYYKVGDRTKMLINDKILTLEMQFNGEFSIKEVEYYD